MTRRRFETERRIAILQEHAADTPPAALMRRPGISRQTSYSWKQRCGALQVSGAKRRKTLDEEDRRRKRLGADQALNLQTLKDVLGKGS